jgi:ABC-type methionine transport system ATPase subunit
MQVAVGLIFPGSLQDESIICCICKNYGVNLNIIEASFSMASGWAFLTLEGEKSELDKVFKYLDSKGIKIERIETRQE